jgi:outer membrane receptor for ferrienterochelin and colicin
MYRTYAALERNPAPGKRRAGFRIAFRLMTILVLAATAIAQQGAKDLSEASLEELTNIQVYSASKHMQSASEAPASVTVVAADEIQKYGYRNLADILRSVPGFYVTYDRDYTFVGVRGFGRLGDWNSRVLVLIDGHRINNNVLGQAMLGNEFLVDVDMSNVWRLCSGPVLRCMAPTLFSRSSTSLPGR